MPDAWEEGTIKGIVARGNFTVDISWKEGKLSSSKIISNQGGNCTIRCNEPFKIDSLNLKSEKTMMGYTIKFKAKKGKSYVIKPTL